MQHQAPESRLVQNIRTNGVRRFSFLLKAPVQQLFGVGSLVSDRTNDHDHSGSDIGEKLKLQNGGSVLRMNRRSHTCSVAEIH